jgi:hypothetical protein
VTARRPQAANDLTPRLEDETHQEPDHDDHGHQTEEDDALPNLGTKIVRIFPNDSHVGRIPPSGPQHSRRACAGGSRGRHGRTSRRSDRDLGRSVEGGGAAQRFDQVSAWAFRHEDLIGRRASRRVPNQNRIRSIIEFRDRQVGGAQIDDWVGHRLHALLDGLLQGSAPRVPPVGEADDGKPIRGASRQALIGFRPSKKGHRRDHKGYADRRQRCPLQPRAHELSIGKTIGTLKAPGGGVDSKTSQPRDCRSTRPRAGHPSSELSDSSLPPALGRADPDDALGRLHVTFARLPLPPTLRYREACAVAAERTCPSCGGRFTPTRGRRYCTQDCWPSRRPRYASEPGEVVTALPASYEEIIHLLWTAARKGSVAAMVTLRRELRDQGEPKEPSIVDQLAARRKRGRNG